MFTGMLHGFVVEYGWFACTEGIHIATAWIPKSGPARRQPNPGNLHAGLVSSLKPGFRHLLLEGFLTSPGESRCDVLRGRVAIMSVALYHRLLAPVQSVLLGRLAILVGGFTAWFGGCGNKA